MLPRGCIFFCTVSLCTQLHGCVFLITNTVKDLRWCVRHHCSVEKSAGLNKCGVICRSQVRFRPKTRQLKSLWIWANRPSSKGSKLWCPVIKADKIKLIKLITRILDLKMCYCSINKLTLSLVELYIYAWTQHSSSVCHVKKFLHAMHSLSRRPWRQVTTSCEKR